jgi:hypothetical protein
MRSRESVKYLTADDSRDLDFRDEISGLVSIEQAWLNLDAEVGTFGSNLAAARDHARARRDELLTKRRVVPGKG